jgi:TrpR-related protein YerC/YecD
MNKKLKSDAMDGLFEAVLSLKNIDECYAFFEDVCTVNELLSFGQRYEVARMLRSGRTYLEIADKTGASTATISRVNRSLNYGNDACDMIFERLKDLGAKGAPDQVSGKV